MLGKHRLAVDRFTEAHWILEPYADEEFALWSEIVPRSDTVYILGREVLAQSFADIFTSDAGDLVFCNLAEGSETIEWQMWKLGVSDLVQRGRLGLMHGGDALSDLTAVRSDIHFTNIVDFVSNQPLVAIAVPMIWQWTPFMMLIILAGLQSQPSDILEAAQVDGASSWQLFTKMTLPHLKQYIQLAIVLGTIYIVQSMDFVFTITQGGPGTDSTIIPYQIYQTMFRKYEYGEAAAAGVIVVILTIILSSFALKLTSDLLEDEK